MKNLTKVLTAAVVMTNLAACAHREPPRSQMFTDEGCNQMPASAVSATPVYQTAGTGCQPSEYTVKTPVEVVYKNTTYRTVYVPQTSQSVSYEKRPYNAAEMCGNGECVY